MLNKILNFADEFDMLPETGLVLVCVSGGADSMCLLEALRDISLQRGFSVGAMHYNHCLRGDESDRDEAFAGEYCAARGVPFYSARGDVRALSKKNGLGIEEAAREMRYGFFTETAAATGAVRIATAHTADDNAETMLLNLVRGAGTAGLSGIPPRRGAVVRPMLCVTREDVMQFICDRGIPFVDDSTNELDLYARNRLRHSVMPLLKEMNPRFIETAASAAEICRADEEFISGLADGFIRENCTERSANAAELLELPFAVSSRVIRKLYGGALSHIHVKAVLDLCGRECPSARLSLPGAMFYREYDYIMVGDASAAEGFAPVYPSDGDIAMISDCGLKLTCKSIICGDRINKSFTSFLFKNAELCGKIAVRPRREGDFIKLSGRNGTKTLKKLFIERRIPARKRALIPVVADDAGVLAVYGLGAGDRAAPEPGDHAILIEFEEM